MSAVWQREKKGSLPTHQITKTLTWNGLTKLIPRVESYKSRTPATPRDTKARGKDSREEMLLNEQVEKLNFVLKSGKEKAESGKIRVEGRASR